MWGTINDLFATLLECGGACAISGGFSNDLYNEELYAPIGLTIALVCVAIPLFYYYGINHPFLARPMYWLLFMLAAAGISGIGTYYIIISKFSSEGFETDYTVEYYTFSLLAGLISIMGALFLSILGKNWSTNCSKTPF